MNASMNASQHITTLRQTHRVATTALPLLTASLTVAGAVLAALEARSAHAASAEPMPGAESADGAAYTGPTSAPRSARGVSVRRLTVWRYLATLLGRALMVAAGIALVLALVYLASSLGRTGQMVLLTILVLFVFYLVEKVAQRA